MSLASPASPENRDPNFSRRCKSAPKLWSFHESVMVARRNAKQLLNARSAKRQPHARQRRPTLSGQERQGVKRESERSQSFPSAIRSRFDCAAQEGRRRKKQREEEELRE